MILQDELYKTGMRVTTRKKIWNISEGMKDDKALIESRGKLSPYGLSK